MALPGSHFDPLQRPPWMIFIDGENLAIRGREVAAQAGLPLLEGAHYQPDTFLWFPAFSPTALLHRLSAQPLPRVVRSHYYTSLVGDDDALRRVRRALRDLDFEPSVFKRFRGREQSKGVDITIARDMLVHGIDHVYDSCLLVAGDGDYIPLVEELKRRARRVHVAFFETSGLNEDLRIEADRFYPLEAVFLGAWDDFAFPHLRTLSINRIGVELRGRRVREDEEPTELFQVRFRRDEHTVSCTPPPDLASDSDPAAFLELLRDGLQKRDDAAAEHLAAAL